MSNQLQPKQTTNLLASSSMSDLLGGSSNDLSITPSVSPATFRRMKPQPLSLSLGGSLKKPLPMFSNKVEPQQKQNQSTKLDYPLSPNDSSPESAKESDAAPSLIVPSLQDKLQQQSSSYPPDSSDSQTTIKFLNEDLEKIKPLGAGSGGQVTLVRHKPTQLLLARKTISCAYMDDAERFKSEKRLLREVRLMKSCKSPYIVTFFGATVQEGDVVLLMEYMDLGTLDHIYRLMGPLPEKIIQSISLSFLQGLAYLDDRKVVHRDIKPSNILMNSRGEVKIADFGISKDFKGTATNQDTTTFIGTQGYLAPERINNTAQLTIAADVWSFGLSMLELALGRFPYGNVSPSSGAVLGIMDLYEMILDEDSPTLPDGFTHEFKEVIDSW